MKDPVAKRPGFKASNCQKNPKFTSGHVSFGILLQFTNKIHEKSSEKMLEADLVSSTSLKRNRSLPENHVIFIFSPLAIYMWTF